MSTHVIDYNLGYQIDNLGSDPNIPFKLGYFTGPSIGQGVPNNTCLGNIFYWQPEVMSPNLPLTYNISGTIPDGLTFSTSTGVLQGAVAQVGIFHFTLIVIDNQGLSTSKSFDFEVYNSPVISTTQITKAVLQQRYDFQFELATGTGVSPFTWLPTPTSILPAGLSFNTSFGTITGIPSEEGNFYFAVLVEDAHWCMDTHSYILQIAAPPEIVNTSLPAVCATGTSTYPMYYEDQNGSRIIADKGTPPYYFFVVDGLLPPGITLNPYTGQLSGQALFPGTNYTFTIQVVDQNGLYTEKQFTIVVRSVFDCGQTNQGGTITVTKSRLVSLESEAVIVMDPFHQRHLIEYLPIPLQGDKISE